MSEQGLYVVWFCFLVWPGQAQVPEPAQCLVSGVYSLVQLPDAKDEKSCWDDCFAEPDCHVAVVTKALSGSHRCLLVNCLNQGNYSVPRDPSSEIQVYPKSSISNGRTASYLVYVATSKRIKVNKIHPHESKRDITLFSFLPAVKCLYSTEQRQFLMDRTYGLANERRKNKLLLISEPAITVASAFTEGETERVQV